MLFVHIARYIPHRPDGHRSKRNYLYLAKYAGNRKICSIVAKSMRFCKYYCITIRAVQDRCAICIETM